MDRQETAVLVESKHHYRSTCDSWMGRLVPEAISNIPLSLLFGWLFFVAWEPAQMLIFVVFVFSRTS